MVANDLGDRVTPAVVAFTDHEIVSCRCYVLVGVRAGVMFLLASRQVLYSCWRQGRCYVLVGIKASGNVEISERHGILPQPELCAICGK